MWKKIRKMMKEKNINQNQLAKLMQVDRSTITYLKNGTTKNPSFKYMCKIADALEVSLDEFRE